MRPVAAFTWRWRWRRLWLVDGVRPTGSDVLGTAVSLLGMAIIVLGATGKDGG